MRSSTGILNPGGTLSMPISFNTLVAWIAAHVTTSKHTRVHTDCTPQMITMYLQRRFCAEIFSICSSVASSGIDAHPAQQICTTLNAANTTVSAHPAIGTDAANTHDTSSVVSVSPVVIIIPPNGPHPSAHEAIWLTEPHMPPSRDPSPETHCPQTPTTGPTAAAMTLETLR